MPWHTIWVGKCPVLQCWLSSPGSPGHLSTASCRILSAPHPFPFALITSDRFETHHNQFNILQSNEGCLSYGVYKQDGRLPVVKDRLVKAREAANTTLLAPWRMVLRNTQIPCQLNMGNAVVSVLVKEMKMAEL